MNTEIIRSRDSTVASQYRNADCSNALAKHGYLVLDQFARIRKNEIVKRDKDVLPTAVIPLEIQTVLPKVCRDRAVRLQVDIVRIPRSRIATEAQSQSEVLVVGHVVAYLSKQRRPGLRPKPGITTPNPPLNLWTDRQPHLAPEPGSRGAPTTRVPFRRLVEREMEGGRPTDIRVAPGSDVLDVLLVVELQKSERCPVGRVRAFHAEDLDGAIGEIFGGPVQIRAEV